MTTYDEQAAVASVIVDEHFPGWVDQIDLSTLDMARWHHCIGGQLCGGYDQFAHQVGMADQPDDVIAAFNAPHPDDAAELTDAWRRLISERRFANGAIKAELLAV